MSRSDFPYLKEQDFANYPAVYVLIGGNKRYVGQAAGQSISLRLSQHFLKEDKAWVESVLFFARADGEMSKADTDYLERRLIQDFQEKSDEFLTKKRVKNDGSYAQQYYVENSHPAIIPRDIFIQAQQELDRHKSMKNKQSQCFSGKHALSGITVCGDCGYAYRRVHWKNRGTVWRCKSRVVKREHNCNGRTIYEKDLHEAIIQAINETLIDRDSFLQQLNN